MIIDYSVSYAIAAGFTTVIFIIRKEMKDLFKKTVGDRISKQIETKYIYQRIDNIPNNFRRFSERKKPWGTAHALYCCRDLINENFAVINADDYYGKEAFCSLGKFLDNPDADGCSIGFILKNTLSDNGTVSRGICKADTEGMLKSVIETKNIIRNTSGIIMGTVSEQKVTLDENDIVSMSMWGFTLPFMDILSDTLSEFFVDLSDNDLKSELSARC